MVPSSIKRPAMNTLEWLLMRDDSNFTEKECAEVIVSKAQVKALANKALKKMKQAVSFLPAMLLNSGFLIIHVYWR